MVGDADDEDYGYIDEEICRFAKELQEKQPIDMIVQNAL